MKKPERMKIITIPRGDLVDLWGEGHNHACDEWEKYHDEVVKEVKIDILKWLIDHAVTGDDYKFYSEVISKKAMEWLVKEIKEGKDDIRSEKGEG